MSEAKEIIKMLDEKSLSRLFQQTQDHDTGTITAFRSAEDCGEGEPYSKKENKQRNKSLLAKLKNLGYGVTSVKGIYIENFNSPKAKEVKENVFFVVDLKDKGNLKSDLISLGKEFDQDSILFTPKGAQEALLIGTNDCPNAFPGMGQVKKFSTRKFGSTAEFFTRVGNKPFAFLESVKEHKLPKGVGELKSCHLMAKEPWQNLHLSDSELAQD